MEDLELIQLAYKARELAYVPYSSFPVGAAVLTSDGLVFTGCNIENVSFGATNCAERTAIFKAVSEGHTEIEAIAVVGALDTYTFPCGICRQVLAEFAKPTVKIIIGKEENQYIVQTLADILPTAFTKEALAALR